MVSDRTSFFFKFVLFDDWNIVRDGNNIEETSNNINHIDEYTIRYFEQLLKKYGKENKRLTDIILFDSISARRVIQTNKKLYVNRENGFFGTSLKKHEFIVSARI